MEKNNDTNKIQGARKLLKCVGEEIKPGEFYLHPITLQLRQNTSTELGCPSEIGYHNEKKEFYDLIRSKNQNIPNKLEIKKFMALPYVGFSSGQILKLYNISSLIDLIEWIKKQNKNEESFEYVNRIIKIFIHYYIMDFKKTTKVLIESKLISIVLENYKKKINLKNEKVNKYIEEYIIYWFSAKDVNDFDLDLISDLYKYLKKKLKN